MPYTIGEVAKKMNVAPSTLRYYDKEGLLPFIQRSENGIRFFTEKDFEILSVIHCLKQTGISIKDIKRYIDMIGEGDKSIDARLELFRKEKESVENKIQEMERTLAILEYKCWYYETSKKDGTMDYVDKMTFEEMPEKFAKIKRDLGKLDIVPTK